MTGLRPYRADLPKRRFPRQPARRDDVPALRVVRSRWRSPDQFSHVEIFGHYVDQKRLTSGMLGDLLTP
jgi:hypothetical protein